MPEINPALVEDVAQAALKIGIGAVSGLSSAAKNIPAPQLHGARTGLTNNSAKFFNGVSQYHKAHKGILGALGAGATAVVGHGTAAVAAGAVITAAAPFVAAGAAIAVVSFGICKLYEKISDA